MQTSAIHIHGCEYGTASGGVDCFELPRLHAKSLSVARSTLRTFIAGTTQLRSSAAALFDIARSGALRLEVNRRYTLSDVRRAHLELEKRSTIGADPLRALPQPGATAGLDIAGRPRGPAGARTRPRSPQASTG